jgi:hypothetical protein
LFNGILKENYKDYDIITNGKNVNISGDYHAIDDDDKKISLSYEHDISIAPENIKTQIGFEMVTPILSYND